MATTGISSASVGTASGGLVSACTGRHYLRIKNEHATASMAVNFGGTAALNTAGNFTITAGNSIEWTHPSDSAVNAIGAVASLPATIEEW